MAMFGWSIGFAALLALAACQLGGARQDTDAAGQNPVLQGDIAVTSLAPAAGAAPASAAPVAAPVTPPQSPAPDAAAPAPQPAPETTAAEIAPPKSAAELACQDQGGTWAHAGKSPGFTCIRPTRDAGKACHRQSECEGLCLARSGSCSPVAPLFGCNDILQDDGRRVTLCID